MSEHAQARVEGIELPVNTSNQLPETATMMLIMAMTSLLCASDTMFVISCALIARTGEFIKTWRRRWFILKQGKIFWFKTDEVGPVRKHFPASLLRVWMQTYLSSPTHLTDLYP